MIRMTLAAGLLLVLAACTAAQKSDATACAIALLASGQRDAAELARLALATPSCQALAADAVDAAVAKAKGVQ